jgi:hypothetical protein
MCISRTNAKAREKELSFSTTIKTLKILLHTNPSDFTSNFKPHTILNLVYIEIKNIFQIGKTFQTPPQVAT